MIKGRAEKRREARYGDSAHESRAEQAAAEARIPRVGPRGKFRHLPWPERFTQVSRTPAVLSMVGVAAYGSLCVWAGLRAIAENDPDPGARAVGVIGVLVLLFLVPLYRARVRRRVRSTYGVRTGTLRPHNRGLLLPYARGTTLLSWIGVLAGLVGAAVMITVIPLSSVGGYRQDMAAPAGVCVAAGALWWAGSLLLTGWRKRGVLINADGVVLYGTGGRHVARWDQIAEVEAVGLLHEERYEGIHIRVYANGAAGGDGPVVPSGWLIRRLHLGIDPVLTHQILCFYRENPAARAELSGPAAVHRLKNADVPAYVQPNVAADEGHRQWIATS
ncbi:hypothetical protein ATL42_2542 [Sanguibacter antarcticus]|uniref:Uncharacterized protein n=2 Tax=Sanguibacter antarcticus TaxID=372484 RepID=A0A2A9E8I3_9MICO|nr:hypothetical protein ATL42_2542 [Sanguibacter antarcticus]